MTNKYAKMCEVALRAEAEGEGRIGTVLIVDVIYETLKARNEDQDVEVLAKFVERLDRIDEDSAKVPEETTRKLRADWERKLLRDPAVKRIASRLAGIDDDGAQELLDRINGEPGQYDQRAWQEWCSRQAKAAESRNDTTLAAVLNTVAKGRSLLAPDCVQLATTPNEDGMHRVPTKPRVRALPPRQQRFQYYIDYMNGYRDEYTEGKTGTEEAQLEFWERFGETTSDKPYRAFQKDLQNACADWSKKHGGVGYQALYQQAYTQLKAWPRGWRWPSDWPLPSD